MYQHAHPVTTSELKGLEILIKCKGSCHRTGVTCLSPKDLERLSGKMEYSCPKDIQTICNKEVQAVDDEEIYKAAVEIYMDLFGEAALFEVLL